MKKVKIARKSNIDDYLEEEDTLTIIINLKNCKIFLSIISFTAIFCILYYIFTVFRANRNNYKNYINVSYAFDGNYHYITHVSMKSIMLSQNKTTFINFYMLVSNINDEEDLNILTNMLKLAVIDINTLITPNISKDIIDITDKYKLKLWPKE